MSIEILKNQLKCELDKNDKYREMLFRRGYLLTDTKLENISNYPFYSLWSETIINNFYLYVQKEQTFYVQTRGNVSSVIIGHAYNPFNMMYDENEICQELISSYKNGLNSYFDKVSELTGLHIIIIIDGDKIIACQDACSLTGCYFGKVKNSMYISEHADDFSADEKTSLRVSVIRFANEQIMANYAAYNRNMLLEMIKYGAPEVHINKYYIDESRLDSLKLQELPENWYD